MFPLYADIYVKLNVTAKSKSDVVPFGKIVLKNQNKIWLPIEDSAVLVFLSLSLMSWRSASRSLPSGFSSFTATKKMKMMRMTMEIITCYRLYNQTV